MPTLVGEVAGGVLSVTDWTASFVCAYAGSLRALVDSMQMDLQMANARLYDELQTPSRDRSPSPARVRRRNETIRALSQMLMIPVGLHLRV